jgi:hypothetical protein
MKTVIADIIGMACIVAIPIIVYFYGVAFGLA